MTSPTIQAVQSLPELPEPSAWVSLNVLTQKASVGKLPITSLQPGVYQNEKVFSEDQMRAYALAAIAAKEAEVGRLREALKLAEVAMNHMGDALNNMDAVEVEDLVITEPAFKAVRAALTQGETK